MKDIDYMKSALLEAIKAKNKDEVPIGAVIVYKDQIIGRGHNLRETLQQSYAHAEMIAIQEACKTLGTWRLDDCSIYVSLEPCAMCAGAIIQSRIKRVVYAITDPKNGAHVSKATLFDFPFNHKVKVETGLMQEEAKLILKDFFIALRKDKDSV